MMNAAPRLGASFWTLSSKKKEERVSTLGVFLSVLSNGAWRIPRAREVVNTKCRQAIRASLLPPEANDYAAHRPSGKVREGNSV